MTLGATPPPRGALLHHIADKTADFASILAGIAQFAAETDVLDILPPPNSETLADAVRQMLGLPQTTVILATDNDGVAGGIGLFIAPYALNPSRLSAQELFWWVRPGASPRAAMLLLREAQAFAKSAGVTILSFSRLMTSPAGVDAAYRRMGLRPAQVNYVGLLK